MIRTPKDDPSCKVPPLLPLLLALPNLESRNLRPLLNLLQLRRQPPLVQLMTHTHRLDFVLENTSFSLGAIVSADKSHLIFENFLLVHFQFL